MLRGNERKLQNRKSENDVDEERNGGGWFGI
jgi:hypothetical protein